MRNQPLGEKPDESAYLTQIKHIEIPNKLSKRPKLYEIEIVFSATKKVFPGNLMKTYILCCPHEPKKM